MSVAKRLREAGRLDEAIALAERGLKLKGIYAYEIGTWLAPLEESQGRNEMVLLAYRSAFDAHPAIELYRHIKRLAGPNWETLPGAFEECARTVFLGYFSGYSSLRK